MTLAVMENSSDTLKDAIEQRLQDQFGKWLSFLGRVVSINSYSLDKRGVDAVQNCFQEELEVLGLAVERIKKQECGDFVRARTTTAVKNSVLLLGHNDTVFPESYGFEGFEVKGNTLCGPGTVDMKGGNVVVMMALDALRAEGLLDSVPVDVLFTSDEELGSPYAASAILECCKSASAALVFEAGRPKDNLVLARKGFADQEVIVSGVSAHSGNHHKDGANAIVQLSQFCLKIAELTNYEKGFTVNPGVITGGTVSNQIPDEARMLFDMRFITMDAFEENNARVKKILETIDVPGCSVRLESKAFMPPMEKTDSSVELFKEYREAGRRAGLDYGIIEGVVGGGSDANRTSGAGIPTIDGLGPRGGGAHSREEYIEKDSMIPKALNLALFLAGRVAG